MILRRVAVSPANNDRAGTSSSEFGDFEVGGSRSTSLSSRVATSTVAGVTLAVGATAIMSYFAVFGTAEQAGVGDLDSRAVAVLSQTNELVNTGEVSEARLLELVETFRSNNPGYSVAVSPSQNQPFIGDTVPVDRLAEKGQPSNWTRATFGSKWVSVLRSKDGVTVALSRESSTISYLESRLKAMLIGVVGLGILLAAVVGTLIGRVTVRPLDRLRRAIDGVTETDELKPVEVVGDDEYSRLTESLNEMMGSLKDSRVRQSQLVADAGHELRTPLTSMRTNIELLLMLHRSGQVATMTSEDLEDLERDVNGQMEEMSTLIGDLVDLAREEEPQREHVPTRLDEVLDDALDRVQRRRPDVNFTYRADPWLIDADRGTLSRAPVNLLDNAAKWSPPGGVVRVSLRAGKNKAVLVIDDSGPGIPPEERMRVFERFYRSAESRAMPGSGLGLSIAQQVLARHGATIDIGESDDNGTRIRVVFPGKPVD